MKHNLVLFSLCCAVSLATTVPAEHGADLPPNVLAKNRWMELTRGDYDAALAKVPEKLRWEFATSPKRLQDLLNGMLVTKTLAAQAHAHGAKPVPVRGKGPAADADRAMAAAELQRIAADAGKSFDANRQAYEAKAREIYDLDREKFRAPEEIRLSDIAIGVKDRGDDAALARAREARARVAAGADFAAVAREYSDDATTREKGGALPFVSRKALAPSYASAVFALTKIGEVPEPIKGPAAYHVVRLEERRAARVKSFEEVRESIMQAQRVKYAEEQRDQRIRAIHADPELQINQPAIDALVNPIDPKVFAPKGAATSGKAATPGSPAPPRGPSAASPESSASSPRSSAPKTK